MTGISERLNNFADDANADRECNGAGQHELVLGLLSKKATD
jgi:hypothetical protein